MPNNISGILRTSNILRSTLIVNVSKSGSLRKYFKREIIFLLVKSRLSIVLNFYAPISFRKTKKIIIMSSAKLI